MARLNQQTSSTAWTRAFLYLIARLGRERSTRHMVAALRSIVDRFDRVAAATIAADRNALAARGNTDAADADLDDLIIAFELNLLLAVGKNRKSPLYRMVFPEGLSSTTRTTTDEQIRLARRLEEAIARELPDRPFAREALPEIRTAREELERQNGTLKAATDRLNAARTAERAVRVEAATAYRMTYGELVKLFPENVRKTRSFFQPSRTAGAAEETPDEPPAIDGTPDESTTPDAEPKAPAATVPS